jgi:hypothetical protein
MKLELQGDIQKLMKLNDKVNVSVQVMLIDIWQFIMNRAKENSPYLTWALRRSIANDFNSISKWFAVVGSPLSYASLREFVNNKNPQTRHYLERWYSEHKPEIYQIMAEDLNDNIKK